MKGGVFVVLYATYENKKIKIGDLLSCDPVRRIAREIEDKLLAFEHDRTGLDSYEYPQWVTLETETSSNRHLLKISFKIDPDAFEHIPSIAKQVIDAVEAEEEADA